jgi:hypothetical protein
MPRHRLGIEVMRTSIFLGPLMALLGTTLPALAADPPPASPQPEPAPASAPAPASVPPPGMVSAEASPPPGMLPPAASPPPAAEQPITAAPADTGSVEPAQHTMKNQIAGFVAWAVNMPLGGARDFTSNVSPLGIELHFRGWILPQLSLGMGGDWSTYLDDRPRTVYQLPNGAVTATAYNYMQTSSVRTFLDYYFLESGPVLPYLGAHVGIAWASFQTQAADLAFSDTALSVAFGGEAGALFKPDPSWPLLMANLRYSAMPTAEFRQVASVQTLGLFLGIGF